MSMAQASGFVPGKRHMVYSRGCEIFVGGLLQSVTENMIEKLFSPYGEILELRMMKDLNGNFKGFCFVRFASKESAHAAVKDKDGYMLNGKRIGVALSSDQDTLFLGNLCKEWSFKDFEKLVNETFKDVLSVDLSLHTSNRETVVGRKQLNRGFGFVQFSSHAAAARAFRFASEPNFYLGDIRPAVQWAEKEPEIDPEEMAKIKVAFVGNLPVDADEEFLKMLFEPFGKLEKVAISRKGHFPVGFVHFAWRSDLDNAIRTLDGTTVYGPHRGPGFQIQVSIAKPIEKTKKRPREDLNGDHHDPYFGFKSKTPKHDTVGLDVVDSYEEAVVSLPLALKDRLLQILRLGIATRYDIDVHCISALKQIPVAAAIAVLEQFMLSGGKKQDKGAYFSSLVAVHQGHRTGTSRRYLDHPRSSLDGPPEKSEMLPHAFIRRPVDNVSTRQNRHSPPPALTRYASPPRDPISSRSVVRVVRKMSPAYESVPSSALVHRSHARSDSIPTVAAQHPSGRPQFRFDPFTGKPYKFDPFTGEPIQSEPAPRQSGGYYY